MDEDLTLSEAQLFKITGYKRAKDQQRHFTRLGVPSIVKPDNTLSVCRAHYERPPEVTAGLAGRKEIRSKHGQTSKVR